MYQNVAKHYLARIEQQTFVIPHTSKVAASGLDFMTFLFLVQCLNHYTRGIPKEVIKYNYSIKIFELSPCFTMAYMCTMYVLMVYVLTNYVHPYGVRSYGVRSYGVRSYGVRSYGVSSYGVRSYGVRSYSVCSYGVHSYGVCSYGIRSYGIYAYKVHTADQFLWYENAWRT
jgi:hypothetical protein